MAEMNVVHQSELRNRLVIDLDTTDELGRFAYFLLDVTNHQVEGLVCRSGLLGQEQTPVMWVQVESIGNDSILIRRSGGVITERLDDALMIESQEIWTDSGNKVGHLTDFGIDPDTGLVKHYLFTAPGWQGFTEGVYKLQPEAIVSTGKKRMMVHQTALETASQYSPGVQGRVTGALHQDLEQTHQDWQKVVSSAQTAADQVQQQTQKLTGQAQSKVGGLFGEVKRRSKQLRAQVNERFADVASNLETPKGKSDTIPGATIDVDSEEIWSNPDASAANSDESAQSPPNQAT